MASPQVSKARKALEDLQRLDLGCLTTLHLGGDNGVEDAPNPPSASLVVPLGLVEGLHLSPKT
ncbi:cell wall biogenesis protein phosphatase [Moniliophthora roreri]|nr:cell wall biogenesis protein phosphatase [Moniliophthora roreri]